MSIWHFERKNSTFGKFVHQACPSWILRLRKAFKDFSKKTQSFSMMAEQNLFGILQAFSGGFSKLKSNCPEDVLRERKFEIVKNTLIVICRFLGTLF